MQSYWMTTCSPAVAAAEGAAADGEVADAVAAGTSQEAPSRATMAAPARAWRNADPRQPVKAEGEAEEAAAAFSCGVSMGGLSFLAVRAGSRARPGGFAFELTRKDTPPAAAWTYAMPISALPRRRPPTCAPYRCRR